MENLNNYPFSPLRPKDVDEYLQKNPKYKVIWDKIVPRFFTAEEICAYVDKLRLERIKRIERQNNFGTEDQKNIVFTLIKKVTEEIFLKIKIKLRVVGVEDFFISEKEIYQLLGSLMNIMSSKKRIQEKTQEKLLNVLTQQEYKEYFEIILGIVEALVQEYFYKRGIGCSLSEDEIKNFTKQAFKSFCLLYEDKIKGLDLTELRSYVVKNLHVVRDVVEKSLDYDCKNTIE